MERFSYFLTFPISHPLSLWQSRSSSTRDRLRLNACKNFCVRIESYVTLRSTLGFRLVGTKLQSVQNLTDGRGKVVKETQRRKRRHHPVFQYKCSNIVTFCVISLLYKQRVSPWVGITSRFPTNHYMHFTEVK